MSLEQFENFYCPYCGEVNGLSVDLSGGTHQEFVVDCEVCCGPIAIRVQIRGDEIISLDVQGENG
jgi:Cysteine-rich CPXCG